MPADRTYVWYTHWRGRTGRGIGRGRTRVDANENAAIHKARHLDAYYDEDGSLVGMFRLGRDEGAALLAALTLGKDVLRDQKRSAERSGVTEQPTPDGDDCSA